MSIIISSRYWLTNEHRIDERKNMAISSILDGIGSSQDYDLRKGYEITLTEAVVNTFGRSNVLPEFLTKDDLRSTK